MFNRALIIIKNIYTTLNSR